MSGFYLFLSSADCKKVFADNRFDNFRVQFEPEIKLACECRQEWSFALTEISIITPAKSHSLPPETCTVLCDLAEGSYMRETYNPILRRIDTDAEASGSLFQTYYIGVNSTQFNCIRIYLKNKDLEDLDAKLWHPSTVVNLTLHFQKM